MIYIILINIIDNISINKIFSEDLDKVYRY